MTSAVDITGDGWQKVSFDKIAQRFVTGIITMEVTDVLIKSFSRHSQEVSNSFFDNTQYSDEVLKKMEMGDYHDFPELVRQFEEFGIKETFIGGDGNMYQSLIIPGTYNNQIGQYEFIKNSEGLITHRFFRPL